MDDKTNFMSPRPLGAGSQVDRYQIREVLGMGGLGITYRANDDELDREVAIREYLPTSYALRQGNFDVKPATGDHVQRYAHGLANFLRVAKTLEQFRHDNIVKVHSIIETNNTAYMVMESENGVGLDSIIAQCTTLEQNHQAQIFFPIFDGLQEIHELGFVHRSIKPANIRIREDGSPVLLDFGSARQTSLRHPMESTALVNQDYMPLEQFSDEYGEQGPWTDIYSLAAIMYQVVTGSKPDEALSRSDRILRDQSDTVQELLAEDYPTYHQLFLSAVHSGLTVQPKSRPRTLAHWRLLFEGEFESYRRQSPDSITTPQQDRLLAASNEIKSGEIKSPDPVSNDNPEAAPLVQPSSVQPSAQPIRAADNERLGEVDIPLESAVPDDTSNEYPNSGILPMNRKYNKRGGLLSLALGSLVVAGIAVLIGIMYLKNNDVQRGLMDNMNETDSLDSESIENAEQNVATNSTGPNSSSTDLVNDSTTDTPAIDSANEKLATASEVDTPADNSTTEAESVNSATDASISDVTTKTTAIGSEVGIPETSADIQTNSTSGDVAANSDTANSETTGNTTEAVVANVENATETTQEKIALAESTGAELPAVYFDKPLPNDPQTETPRTILEIAKSSSAFSPIDGMEEELWKDKACTDCHKWTRESLCQQGEFYNSSDDDQVTRIQHPFGGYFKLALKNWAGNDCS